MNFLLDTNIIVHYIRKDATAQYTDQRYQPLNNRSAISIVSFGEIRSIATQSLWGKHKLLLLEDLLQSVLRADLTMEIVERYAEIDAYSQNKLADRPLGISARNMGKNDLWIAATASILGATLITTDQDFDHLNGVYLDLLRVTVQVS